MPNLMLATPFEHIHEADEIAIYISMRIFQRIPHASLRSEVHNPIKPVLSKQRRHARPIGQLPSYERKTGLGLQSCKPRLFEANIIIIVEIIEPDDRIPACQQHARHRRTDKPGGTRD